MRQAAGVEHIGYPHQQQHLPRWRHCHLHEEPRTPLPLNRPSTHRKARQKRCYCLHQILQHPMSQPSHQSTLPNRHHRTCSSAAPSSVAFAPRYCLHHDPGRPKCTRGLKQIISLFAQALVFGKPYTTKSWSADVHPGSLAFTPPIVRLIRSWD